MKLEVKYWPEDKNIHTDIDEVIEQALKGLGFERWASGYATEEDCRDLAFERPNDPDLKIHG